MLLRFQGYIPFRFVLCDNEGPYLFSLLVSLLKKNKPESQVFVLLFPVLLFILKFPERDKKSLRKMLSRAIP